MGTAMTNKNNTYENHSDSSTSVSSKSSKGFVKLATLTSSSCGGANNKGGVQYNMRARNSESFSKPKINDDLFAGSAASPDATALPQPPKAWLTDIVDAKKEESSSAKKSTTATTAKAFGKFTDLMEMEKRAAAHRARNYSAPNKPTTTTTTPPPANVQKFFASFNSLVPTTA